MDNLKRSEFIAGLFGAPAVAKAIDITPRPDGKPPLLVFEAPERIHADHIQKIRDAIEPLRQKAWIRVYDSTGRNDG